MDHSANERPAVLARVTGALSVRWCSEFIDFGVDAGGAETPRSLDLGAVLMFPHAERNPARRLDFLDLSALWDSVERAGRHPIVNCSCGVPADARVDGGIQVHHPSPGEILWEIDVRACSGLFPEPCPWEGCHGVLQLVFEREAYESVVRDIARAMRQRAVSLMPLAELDACACPKLEAFREEHPGVIALPVSAWLPSVGEDPLAEIAEFDTEQAFRCEPTTDDATKPRGR